MRAEPSDFHPSELFPSIGIAWLPELAFLLSTFWFCPTLVVCNWIMMRFGGIRGT
jgi:hypothetical protein